MGTRTTDRDTEKIDCATCGEEYHPSCDHQQGRCPHHPPLIKLNLFGVMARLYRRITGDKT